MLFERGVARTQEQVLAHFIVVALRLHQSGRLEDVGNKQATQFALFKAFASSNPRLTGRSRKEVVRFERFPRRPNNQWST
jgi:hypothetical protein